MTFKERVLLDEDNTAPEEAEKYKQCEICTVNSPVIWGEGNPCAPIIVILDNPGERKDKKGNFYVCGVRQTIQQIIEYVDLDLHDFYITYLLKCRPLRKYNKQQVREFSKPFLIKQIENIQPKYLVCLGDVVVQSLLGDSQTSVKILRGRWNEVLSIPTMISYHPLAVRRRPNLMRIFQEDWLMLSEKIKNNYFKNIEVEKCSIEPKCKDY